MDLKSDNNIEVPKEIFETRPVNGFQSDLIKFKNGDIYQGYFRENNKKDEYGIYIKKMVIYIKVYGRMRILVIMEYL